MESKKFSDPKSRYRKIRNVLIYILFLNWGVAAGKLFYGWMIHSASITADGFHSFSDGSSNIIGLLGIWAASRPVDDCHPYGHQKYEALTTVGIAALLVMVCINIVREGIGRFLHPMIPEITSNSFLVMGITLAVNIFAMVYERRQGRALKSNILLSDSIHTRTDILISISVIFTLIAIRSGYPVLDPVVSLIIAALIAIAALRIVQESFQILSDRSAIRTEDIQKAVLGIRQIRSCHRIRSRGPANDIHIDLHVQVDPKMEMKEAHRLSYEIEITIKKTFSGIADVVVHLEPSEEETDRPAPADRRSLSRRKS